MKTVFYFAWFNQSTLLFGNKQTQDLYEVDLPPHHYSSGFIEQGFIVFPKFCSKEGKILYSHSRRDAVTEAQMIDWLNLLTGLPRDQIALEPSSLP